MAFLRSLSRTLFINSAKIKLGQIKTVSYSVLSTQTHLPQACPTPHLVIKSCSRKHHGHLIGPLGLILPLTHLMVPEMQTTWVTHQPVRKLPPDLRQKHINSPFSVHTQPSTESECEVIQTGINKQTLEVQVFTNQGQNVLLKMFIWTGASSSANIPRQMLILISSNTSCACLEISNNVEK